MLGGFEVLIVLGLGFYITSRMRSGDTWQAQSKPPILKTTIGATLFRFSILMAAILSGIGIPLLGTAYHFGLLRHPW